MLPTDPEIAKLRILIRRADRHDEKIERLREELHAADKAKHDELMPLWTRWRARCKALGYCDVCERPLEVCRADRSPENAHSHIWLAAGER